jgi:hypothetical protein
MPPLLKLSVIVARLRALLTHSPANKTSANTRARANTRGRPAQGQGHSPHVVLFVNDYDRQPDDGSENWNASLSAASVTIVDPQHAPHERSASLVTPDEPIDLRELITATLREQSFAANEIAKRACGLLRERQWTAAQQVLEYGSDLYDRAPAFFFNLCGVTMELANRMAEAADCYRRSVAADAQFAPAAINLLRLNETKAARRNRIPIFLGDEPDCPDPSIYSNLEH